MTHRTNRNEPRASGDIREPFFAAQDYASHRAELAARAIVGTAATVVGAVLLYGAVEYLLRRPVFFESLPLYLAQVLIPTAIAVASRWTPARATPWLLFTGDLLFTAALTALFAFPSTTVSGAALIYSLKMIATAVFLPWSPWFQLVSSVITLGAYYGLFLVDVREVDRDAVVHQVAGPAVGCLFSMIGAWVSDRARYQAYLFGARLAQVERYLGMVLEHLPIGLWLTDEELRVKFALVGRSLPRTPDVVGRRLNELFQTTDPQFPPLRAHLDALSGLEASYEFPWDDEHFAAQLRPWKDGKGHVQGVVGIAWSISAQKRAAELQQREVELSQAAARSAEAILGVHGVPELFETVARLCLEILGTDFSIAYSLDPSEQRFRPVLQLGLDAESWESLQMFAPTTQEVEQLWTALQTQAVFPLRVPERGRHPWFVLARRFKMTDLLHLGIRHRGQLVAIVSTGFRGRTGNFSDVAVRMGTTLSHLAALGYAKAHLVQELEDASRVKSDFVATMSHELRTPLNVILGYTSLLLEGAFGELGPEQREVLQRLESSAQQLLDLITMTLDFSRIEARQVSITTKRVDVHAFLREIEEEMRRVWTKPSVELRMEVAANLPPVETDPVKLSVVLKNLIQNAMKFTDAGEVVVQAQPTQHGLLFRVRDTGMGIPTAAIDSIFQPFWQVDSSSTRRHGGVGLGLYIVRRLLELLGGRITVESQVGQGSTFAVWIPERLNAEPDTGAEATSRSL